MIREGYVPPPVWNFDGQLAFSPVTITVKRIQPKKLSDVFESRDVKRKSIGDELTVVEVHI